MCYSDDSRPPIPPGDAGAIRTEDLVLTASDGNQFAAYLATPSSSDATTQIIIYPDVRGLHQFYKELANRFAEVGVTALAIDYFGRTAGLTSRAEPFEFMPHVQQMTIETFTLDVEAAVDRLRQLGSKPIFVIGFCMGGSLVIITGTDTSFRFAGLIPFYSGFGRAFGSKGTALDAADQVVYPLIGFYGGADQGIPESALKQFDEKLDKAGVEHEVVVYPGAPHSFFDRRAEEFAEASADSWKRLLNFIVTHSNPVHSS